jgi:hypothetical protein
MTKVFDFLWWWGVEPRDDWPHLSFMIACVLVSLLIGMTFIFLEGVMNPYARRAKWQSLARPGWLVAMYFGAGAVIGSVSALLIKKPLIHPTGVRYASLLVAPLIVGMLASSIAYLRGPRRSPAPRLRFWSGLALAAGVVVTRIAIR